jgi:tartrate dehydrogenase/decarboxylase/D-malate dehydrogenase
MIWSGALMLDFLGHGDANCRAAHDAIVHSIERVLLSEVRTPDLGGRASTTDVGVAVAASIIAGAR